MKTEEIMIWLIVVFLVWLMPLGVYAIERNVLRCVWQKLFARFKRQSLPIQLFLALFVSVAVLRGGSKTTGRQGRQMNGAAVNGMMQTMQNENGDEDDLPSTNDRL